MQKTGLITVLIENSKKEVIQDSPLNLKVSFPLQNHLSPSALMG